MPRFAANLTMMFNEVGFLDRFAAAADAGFDAVEYLFPYTHDAARIAEALQANGLTQVLFNLPPGNWDAGERGLAALRGRQTEFREGVATALLYARATKVGRVHMMSGLADRADPVAQQIYRDSLAYLCDAAGAVGLDVLIEPINARDMPGYFLNDFNQSADLIATMRRPNLKLQFDIYHRQISHGDVLTGLRTLLPITGLKRPTAQGARVADVSFDLHKGEVLDFFGLVGSGRTEVMEMIFGARASVGSIAIDRKTVTIREPSQAIDQGIGFVTEDRKELGLVLGMSVRENFSLTHLSDYCAFDVVDRKRGSSACRGYIRSLGIKTPSPEQKVLNLSGGNQQKVVIAKWVARRPRILIVDEPTGGIDVGAKAEVHSLLNKLAEAGMSIIVVSSDLPEVLAISDRVVVLKEGRITGVLPRAEATQERIMLATTA